MYIFNEYLNLYISFFFFFSLSLSLSLSLLASILFALAHATDCTCSIPLEVELITNCYYHCWRDLKPGPITQAEPLASQKKKVGMCRKISATVADTPDEEAITCI